MLFRSGTDQMKKKGIITWIRKKKVRYAAAGTLCLAAAIGILVLGLGIGSRAAETVNLGTGKELTIRELTELVAKVVGYTGEIKWDPSKPDGTPRKLLDVSKLESLGYHYTTELEEGIRLTYEDFLNNPMRAER